MAEPLLELRHRRGVLARLMSSGLCAREVSLTSTRDVIGWWESRRIPFNLIVGAAGVLSCLVAGLVAIAGSVLFDSDFGLPDPPIFAVFAILLYGVTANVCFTGGWIVELLVRRLWPREADRFATLSFSLGLVFSVVLTLAPGILIAAGGIFSLLRHLSGATHR